MRTATSGLFIVIGYIYHCNINGCSGRLLSALKLIYDIVVLVSLVVVLFCWCWCCCIVCVCCVVGVKVIRLVACVCMRVLVLLCR